MGLPALEAWAKDHGQAAFRGRQLHDWLYAKGARSLDQVSVLPKAFREQLAAEPPAAAFDWMGRHQVVAWHSRWAEHRNGGDPR
jgi:23S rRNA (adenine2503-C2)-methyltransferase